MSVGQVYHRRYSEVVRQSARASTAQRFESTGRHDGRHEDMSDETKAQVDGEQWAAQLESEMTLPEALAVATGAAVILRGRVEKQIAQLSAALGQSAAAPRKQSATPQRRAVPAKQEDATQLVREALETAAGAMSARQLRARTGATPEQVETALTLIGRPGSAHPALTQHGRKYALKAGS